MVLKFYSCVEKRLKLRVESVLPTGESMKKNSAVEFACFQTLNISLLKIFIHLFTLFKVGAILLLTTKNQSTNQKYIRTLNKIKHEC